MIKMLYKRVPDVATSFTVVLEAGSTAPSVQSVHTCIASLGSVGFPVPSWEELLDESDEPQVEEEVDPTQPRRGWQRKALMVVDASFRQHSILPALEDAQVALLRSQAGLMASVAFVAIPSSRETRIDPQPFRLLFLRRLWLPLPLHARSCRCGRPLDVLGHHRAACANAGASTS